MVTRRQLLEVLFDLPRHSILNYINRAQLNERFFRTACESLDDGYIYLVFTCSQSAASAVLRHFTHCEYNHVSIAFDPALRTLLSYNGGSASAAAPGLNPEILAALICRQGASALVYRLHAGRWEKRRILQCVRDIDREGSAYNLFGLLCGRSLRPNIMFCSQFVYTMLDTAGLVWFAKRAGRVRPIDFLELDSERRLEFVGAVRKGSTGLRFTADGALRIDGASAALAPEPAGCAYLAGRCKS